MRILTLTEFLKEPEGTLFQKFTPNILGDLSVKSGNSGESDFYVINLCVPGFVGASDSMGVHEAYEAMVAGESRTLELDGGRDGLFEAKQLFAVWEKADYEDLTKLLASGVTARYQD